jgi:hypothetical protein
MIPFEDAVDISGITVFTFVSFLILLTIINTEPRVLTGRRGWLIITLATLLFAVRAYGHFVEEHWFQVLRRSIGIVNSFLYPLGLYLVYRDIRRGG